MIISENLLFLQKAKKVYDMKAKKTREEVLTKFQTAKEKKRECLVQLEKSMKEEYKKRTGKEVENFFAL